METNATKRTDIYQIDPRNVVVMQDFNVRRDFDLEELKEQIKAKGVLNPITVKPFKDESGAEKYELVDGERRLRATLLAISEGADIPRIKALKAPKDASYEDLLIEQMMRNEGKRFSEYECGIMFKRFKDEFGYTQADIAEKFKKSPAYVSKCLSFMDLPKEIQERIIRNEISAKAAKDIVANYDTELEQVEATKQAVKIAQDQGKKTVTNKEINLAMRDAREAKIIAESLRKVWAYLDGEEVINILQLAKHLDKTESLRHAIKQLKKEN
jgi:ParB family chromosome partitioning protein